MIYSPLGGCEELPDTPFLQCSSSVIEFRHASGILHSLNKGGKGGLHPGEKVNQYRPYRFVASTQAFTSSGWQ